MKKSWVFLPAVALMLVAAGCGNHDTKSTDSSSQEKVSQTQTSKKKAAKSSSVASSSTSSSSVATSSVAKPVASQSAAAPQATGDRLTTLNHQLAAALPGALLPSTYPTGNQVLNASYTGNSANYHIYYGTADQADAFNTPNVHANAAAIELSKQTYGDAASAEAAINYQPVAAANATIPIGDNLKAMQQGGAGSTYTTWQEGRWSITVQANNMNQEDGLPLAKQAVALFSTLALPAPATHGAVNLRVNTGGMRLNTITWRSGNALYTANGVDALTLIRVATSLH
ncbi:hypothetical protein ACFQ5J_08375 [Lacticaseibacillus baoqingensis]|uniref:Lipoprotein n=1 Tax=Lacticaseibacillus baoqingensis TaxID=2486013 RepID=A0ABW4E8D3_9LACO|nr:hypothetical protein [Lacticaseibacillus baoqingensis]